MKRSQCKRDAIVRIISADHQGEIGVIVHDDGTDSWPIRVDCSGMGFDYDPEELELVFDPSDDDCVECCDERPNWSIARAGAIMAGAFLALLALLRRR